MYGIQPMGDESLEMAQVEAGFLAPDVDFHGSLHTVERGHDHSPLELGLGWILNFRKQHFSGRAALIARGIRQLPPPAQNDIEGNKPAQHSILYADRKCATEIGYITSPVVTGGQGQYRLRTGGGEIFRGQIWAEIYHQKELRWQRKVARCTRVTKPFWAPERAKLTPPPDC